MDGIRKPGEPESSAGRPYICLLGADYENSNLGIRALTTGALTALHARHPEACVKIVDYGANPRQFLFDLAGEEISVDLLNIRFSKKPWVKNHIARLTVTALVLRAFPTGFVRKRLLRANPWLQSLMQADYVLAISYGDSFSDIYGTQRFVYVSLPQVLALILKKPLVQLPQTVGPFKSPVWRAVAEAILARCAVVYTRDEAAVESIRSRVPDRCAGRIRFCPDLAFCVPPRKFTPADPPMELVFSGDRPVVGFNVSGLLWMGGYTRDNMFGLASEYRELVRRAVSYLIEAKGASVLLVPHVTSSEGEGDLIACDELLGGLRRVYPDRIFTLRPPYDEREVKDVIARCDFFIGARMHACIAALSQFVPTVAMAYSGKFVGVFRSVGMDAAVCDLRGMVADEVVAAIGASFDSREKLKEFLRAGVPAVCRKLDSLFDECDREIYKPWAAAGMSGRL